jgi:hypothetical protein
LGPAVYEPGEQQRIQAIMAEADEQAKAEVRRHLSYLRVENWLN